MPQGKAAEETTGPTVPIRSSSNAKVPTLGATPMIEQSTANPTSTSRRGSKGSVRPKSRSGSTASKLSKKERANPLIAQDQAKEGTEDQVAAPIKKKRGGLFALLNCCSAPENANTVGGDQAVPAKKAKVLQPKPGRQSTPVVKPNASAAESSTAESKTAEEGIGGPEYSELKAAAKPTMITRSSKERVNTEKPVSQNAFVQPASETKEAPAPTETRDQPLPPLPSSNVAPSQELDMGQGMPSAQTAGIEVPPQLIEPEESVAEQGTTINDRTPIQEQRDSDIAMVDAPPVIQAVEEQPKTTQELAQAQTALPPPPPRNGLDRTTASSSNAVIPNQQQKWLLPPLQPRFQGRKCLVLDLDETLVHSSFKVRKYDLLITIKLTRL